MNLESNNNEKRNRRNKSFVLLASIVMLVLGVVGGTLAYIVANTEAVVNTFNPSVVTCKVSEAFDGKTKTNVKIENTGDTEAYIRAAIVVTWQDGDGNVYGKAPIKGTDYTLTLANAGWNKSTVDGYYYHTEPVPAVGDTETGTLISSCTQIGYGPAEGYTLHVEILAEAIQSAPTTTVETSWGVKIASDGGMAK